MLHDTHKKMKDTTNKFQYHYEQLVGQFIKFPLSFTRFNFLAFNLAQSSICRISHVFVVFIKTVISLSF